MRKPAAVGDDPVTFGSAGKAGFRARSAGAAVARERATIDPRGYGRIVSAAFARAKNKRGCRAGSPSIVEPWSG